MTCSLCHSYFCWNCLALLSHETPYKHFENNPDCFLHDLQNPISEELTEKELAALEDEDKLR
jgi:hypothetical protein